ncbi:MAG: TldD/PmbA family protein [Desulfobacteraceae bacterium]|nr:TldD/PmbA family protein [Desulfobacteraceae bacterium]
MTSLTKHALDMDRPISKNTDYCDSWLVRCGTTKIASLKILNGQVIQSDSCEKKGFFASAKVEERLGWHFLSSTSPGKENDVLEKAMEKARSGKQVRGVQKKDRQVTIENQSIADTILPEIDELLRSDQECLLEYSYRNTDEIIMNDEGGRSRCKDSHVSAMIRQTAFTSNGPITVNSQLTKHGTESVFSKELFEISFGLLSRIEDIKNRDKAPNGFYPVILDSGTGAILAHEIFGHGLEADYVLNNSSPFSGKRFEKVMRSGTTVVDNGLASWGYAKSDTDQEGTKTEQTTLIHEGYLQNYIHTRETANIFKTKPTGNGRAGCISTPPLPRSSNLQILPGDMKLEEICKGIKFGVFAERALGQAFFLPARGVYWIEAESGYLIEDGKLTRPVSSFVVTGTVSKLLHNLIPVGFDILGSLPGFCLKQRQYVPVDVRCPPLYIGKAAISPLR